MSQLEFCFVSGFEKKVRYYQDLNSGDMFIRLYSCGNLHHKEGLCIKTPAGYFSFAVNQFFSHDNIRPQNLIKSVKAKLTWCEE